MDETPAEFIDSFNAEIPMKVFSTAFSDGETMPRQFTGDGDDISPPLRWNNPPQNCREFVLMLVDPDAAEGPRDPFVHWLAYGIPAGTTSLPDGNPMRAILNDPVQFNQGMNSFGKVGYNGPLPPRGKSPHHYVFKLFALDRRLGLRAGANQENVVAAMTDHVLDEDHFSVSYGR